MTAADTHERAVHAALQASDDLKRLFDRAGIGPHPHGLIVSAYRNARRSMEVVLRPGGDDLADIMRLAHARETFAALRRDVGATSSELLRAAVEIGLEQAETEREIYGIAGDVATAAVDIAPAIAAILAEIVRQETWAVAAVAGFSLPAAATAILGDSTRLGLMAPGSVLRTAARWLAGLLDRARSGWIELLERAHLERERLDLAREWGVPERLLQEDAIWYKQVCAVIDQKTTECCLRAHGQAVPLDQPFRLTGSPRYADEQEKPPFHDYCRSTWATIRKQDVRDEYTEFMRAPRRKELQRRYRIERRRRAKREAMTAAKAGQGKGS